MLSRQLADPLGRHAEQASCFGGSNKVMCHDAMIAQSLSIRKGFGEADRLYRQRVSCGSTPAELLALRFRAKQEEWGGPMRWRKRRVATLLVVSALCLTAGGSLARRHLREGDRGRNATSVSEVSPTTFPATSFPTVAPTTTTAIECPVPPTVQLTSFTTQPEPLRPEAYRTTIRGTVTNPSGHAVDIRRIELSVYNEGGAKIEDRATFPTAAALAPGEMSSWESFGFEGSASPPARATTQVVFAYQEQALRSCNPSAS